MDEQEQIGAPERSSSDRTSRRDNGRDPAGGPLPLRSLVAAFVVGTLATGAAFVASGGSIPVFVGVLLALGVAERLAARCLMSRHGGRPRKGWWL